MRDEGDDKWEPQLANFESAIPALFTSTLQTPNEFSMFVNASFMLATFVTSRLVVNTSHPPFSNSDFNSSSLLVLGSVAWCAWSECVDEECIYTTRVLSYSSNSFSVKNKITTVETYLPRRRAAKTTRAPAPAATRAK